MIMMIGGGIPKVPELGRILSELYKEGKLDRVTMGCPISQDGYAKWFYTYCLK